jgi:hypothetical protein
LALSSFAEALSRASARHFPKNHAEVPKSNDNRSTAAHQTEVLMATSIMFTGRSLVTLSLPKSVPALIVYAEGIVKHQSAARSVQAREIAVK